MKYYFCLVLVMSALNGMEAPLDQIGSPPSSPQSHSAPNSPGPLRYNRDQLLAISNSTLSRSMDSTMDNAIRRVTIKVREEPPQVKQEINLDVKKPDAAGQKKPADPKDPFASCRRRYAKK